MKYITKNEISTIIQSKIPVLLEFRSVECPACLKAEKFLEVLSKAYAGKMSIKIINIDMTLQQDYRISRIPLFILFKEGVELVRITGFNNEFDFEKTLRDYLR